MEGDSIVRLKSRAAAAERELSELPEEEDEEAGDALPAARPLKRAAPSNDATRSAPPAKRPRVSPTGKALRSSLLLEGDSVEVEEELCITKAASG